MVNQDLLALFLAMTAAAALLQTGILVGILVMTKKLGKQTDHVVEEARRLMGGPADRAVEALQGLSIAMAEYGFAAKGKLQQFEQMMDRKEPVWLERLNRWEKK
jgi:hypothetical protein